MLKNLAISLCIAGGMIIASAPAAAETAATGTTTKSPKKTLKKKPPAKKQIPVAEAKEAEEDEPDTVGSAHMDYHCELGNKLSIYQNAGDDQSIALRWNRRIHRLTRVDTTTGANRFENRKTGLVWIGIPAKSMLLDSKKGLQLANECMNSEQKKAEYIKTEHMKLAPSVTLVVPKS